MTHTHKNWVTTKKCITISSQHCDIFFLFFSKCTQHTYQSTSISNWLKYPIFSSLGYFEHYFINNWLYHATIAKAKISKNESFLSLLTSLWCFEHHFLNVNINSLWKLNKRHFQKAKNTCSNWAREIQDTEAHTSAHIQLNISLIRCWNLWLLLFWAKTCLKDIFQLTSSPEKYFSDCQTTVDSSANYFFDMNAVS